MTDYKKWVNLIRKVSWWLDLIAMLGEFLGMIANRLEKKHDTTQQFKQRWTNTEQEQSHES